MLQIPFQLVHFVPSPCLFVFFAFASSSRPYYLSLLNSSLYFINHSLISNNSSPAIFLASSINGDVVSSCSFSSAACSSDHNYSSNQYALAAKLLLESE